MERPVERGSDREDRGPPGSDEGHGRGGMGRGGGGFRRRKVCRFCTEKGATIDYRDAGGLRFYVSERGKVVPRRISGNCAKHQRRMARALKRSRIIALVPFSVTG